MAAVESTCGLACWADLERSKVAMTTNSEGLEFLFILLLLLLLSLLYCYWYFRILQNGQPWSKEDHGVLVVQIQVPQVGNDIILAGRWKAPL